MRMTLFCAVAGAVVSAAEVVDRYTISPDVPGTVAFTTPLTIIPFALLVLDATPRSPVEAAATLDASVAAHPALVRE